MKTALILALLLIGFGAVGEMDYRDAVATETANREFRAWAIRNCIPAKPNERAVAEMRHDGSTQCTKYKNAGYGRAPVMVSAAVYP